MVDHVKELACLSKELDSKSDKLKPIITSVNDVLITLNLCIEAWLDDDPIYETEQYTTTKERNVFLCVDSDVLGYCCIGGKWELALKTNIHQRQEGADSPVQTLYKAESKRSLLQASRTEQIMAVTLLHKLLDVVKRQGKQMIEGIDAAENLFKFHS
jgi:hypothetical protein